MDNPIAAPRKPDSFVQDVEDLARDLAYGASIGEWEARVAVGHFAVNGFGYWWADEMMERTPLQEAFFQKWIGPRGEPRGAPGYDVLEAFGFMTHTTGRVSSDDGDMLLYSLTRKAFDLLQKPARAPAIFISYRRGESSAFALLVEARLRIAGADPDRIFIDKDIPGGALWEQHIGEQAAACDAFICLVGRTAFDDGSWVAREIELVKAGSPSARIVPVCHNGARMSDPAVGAALGAYNGTHIQEETALEYERAVSFILNALGYATY